MRDTETPLHGAILSIAVLVKQCAGVAFKTVYPRAGVCRQDLLRETETAAAYRLVFMSCQRD